MRLWFIIFCLFLYASIKAQDPGFSNYFGNRIYLNPAFAGIEEGLRSSVNHRNQWRTLPRNYQTSSFTIDNQLCNFPLIGLGLRALHNRAGAGWLETKMAHLIYSHIIPYGHIRNEGSVSLALEFGVMNNVVDWSKLVFSDQLDPVLGIIYPSVQATKDWHNLNVADVGFGMLLRQRVLTSNGKDILFSIGSKISHLNKPRNGLLNDNFIPLSITLHGGAVLPSTKKRLLVPNFRLLMQDNNKSAFRRLDVGISMISDFLLLGMGYAIHPSSPTNQGGYIEQSDAFNITMSIELKETNMNYRFYALYENNFKGAGNFLNLNTFEIGVSLQLQGYCKPNSKLGRLHNKSLCSPYNNKRVLF